MSDRKTRSLLILILISFSVAVVSQFVYDTEAGWTNPNNDWDAAHQEKYRQQLKEEFPGLATNLIEDVVRNKAPWTKHIIKDRSEMVYTSDNPAVQQFIASLLPDCKSDLLQLLFIDRKNALNMDKLYNARHNVIEDFSGNPLLSFVIVVESDSETAKMEQGLRYRFPNTHIRFVPTESFLDLCEGFRIFSFPEDITINNKGEILKSPLKSYDESTFRQSLKRLQKAFSGKK